MKTPKLKLYSLENQQILIDTFTVKELNRFMTIDRRKSSCKYKFMYKDKAIFVHIGSGPSGLVGISTDGKKFQLTNHTLYTFLSEFNIKPTDLVKDTQ